MVVLSSFSPPTEGIVHSENRTQAHVGSKSFGNGTLFIAASRISWLDDEGKGFSLEYPAVSLHAVCRDLNAFPHECLYLMIDANLTDLGEQEGSSSDEEDSPKISEIRFVPENKDSLQVLYKAMSDCQALHPDEDDSFSDEGEDEAYEDYSEGGYFSSEQDIEHLTPQGQATLQRLEAMLQSSTIEAEHRTSNGGTGGGGEPMETGQFEDADDVQ